MTLRIKLGQAYMGPTISLTTKKKTVKPFGMPIRGHRFKANKRGKGLKLG